MLYQSIYSQYEFKLNESYSLEEQIGDFVKSLKTDIDFKREIGENLVYSNLEELLDKTSKITTDTSDDGLLYKYFPKIVGKNINPA